MNQHRLQFAICLLAFGLCGYAGNVRADPDAACTADSDVTTLISAHPLEQTIARLKASIQTAGLGVLAILHQTLPGSISTQARQQETIIVGGARIRDLATATPLLALELPIKVLVWEDGEIVKVSFKEAECLGQRYDLPPAAVEYLALIEQSAERALRE
jgi:uncharacterized protein (DUF302 family)